MLGKADIIDRALELGFEDIGFTTAEAFESQKEVLLAREEMYAWAAGKGLDLQDMAPHVLHLPPQELWRWKMNAARAMGNSADPQYIARKRPTVFFRQLPPACRLTSHSLVNWPGTTHTARNPPGPAARRGVFTPSGR